MSKKIYNLKEKRSEGARFPEVLTKQEQMRNNVAISCRISLKREASFARWGREGSHGCCAPPKGGLAVLHLFIIIFI